MRKKHLHFIGIKGVGMTALAILALEKGFKVTGSDVAEDFVTKQVLDKHKIPIFTGFNKENLTTPPDLVIVTGAHNGKTNPEAMAWAEEGVEVITHGQAVGRFMENFKGISVCGVGGKTTTSAMLATMLDRSRLDPSYCIGAGSLMPLKNPGHYGTGKYFVAEADEYVSCPLTDPTPRMFYQKPEVIVVTNIIYDHPDIYKSLEHTLQVFCEFISCLPENGFAVINIDSANNREVIKRTKNKKIITYGFSLDANYRVENLKFNRGETLFSLSFHRVNIGDFVLKIPGKFNALNAAACAAVGLNLGLTTDQVRNLASFEGTQRRFEFKGEKDNIKLYDDYAHHPSEISATLLAVKEWFKKEKLAVIFQPHTYSRTKALLKEFSQSFGMADKVYVLPIFSSAREKEDLGVSSQILASEISRYQPNVEYVSDKTQLLSSLKRNIKDDTIILTMGAGDVYKLDEEILKII
ncbi:MAG: UDP-N-acetylmuramate--L-alanine ligase [Patescibacteria group bacterium]|nr:UDP-N-acetylmuramate--L-alanine ligase [Patescibacteria group bacterium]